MIALQNLTKVFGTKAAVNDLTLEISPGEIFGFLGTNGAGKTTTVKMLAGMLIPSSGTASVNGFDVIRNPLEVKKVIGYVPESGALFESLTAWEYLELVSDLHHLKRSVAGQRIEEFLSLFSLIENKDQQIVDFSKGMKQKILLSAAFIHNPSVLYLDEPLNGLDANAALLIKELLKKFAKNGKTIIFCSHILEVVERICTRIAIIHDGQLIEDGTAAELMERASESTLEGAFHKLTGAHNVHTYADDLLQALQTV